MAALRAADTATTANGSYALSDHIGWQACLEEESWAVWDADKPSGAAVTLTAGDEVRFEAGDGWIYVRDAFARRASLFTVSDSVLPQITAFVEQRGEKLPQAKSII